MRYSVTSSNQIEKSIKKVIEEQNENIAMSQNGWQRNDIEI